MDPDTRAAYEAYAEGVNAYMLGKAPRELGLEYVFSSCRASRLPSSRGVRRTPSRG